MSALATGVLIFLVLAGQMLMPLFRKGGSLAGSFLQVFDNCIPWKVYSNPFSVENSC